MKRIFLTYLCLVFWPQTALADRTVHVQNFTPTGGPGLPITGSSGLGMSGSWAVGRLTGNLSLIEPQDALSIFDRNGSEGGAFVTGAPGFLAANVADTRVVQGEDSDRFAGQPIIVLIGNNPLGLSLSTYFILINSGQTWIRENEGAPASYTINLGSGTMLLGYNLPFSGGEGIYAAYNGRMGVTFPRLITSAGASFTSILSVTQIPNSGDSGGVKITLSPEGAVAANAAWQLSPQTTLRLSGQQIVGLAGGIHTVKFVNPGGYLKPPDYGVEVVAGQMREYSVYFEEATLVPQITSFVRTTSSWRLAWRAQVTKTYAVEFSQTLNPADWTEIATGIVPGAQDWSYDDTAVQRLSLKTGFYRLRAE